MSHLVTHLGFSQAKGSPPASIPPPEAHVFAEIPHSATRRQNTVNSPLTTDQGQTLLAVVFFTVSSETDLLPRPGEIEMCPSSSCQVGQVYRHLSHPQSQPPPTPPSPPHPTTSLLSVSVAIKVHFLKFSKADSCCSTDA